MPDGKRFFIHTFGCKSNQYESQAMREALIAIGLAETSRVEEADVCVVNTCAVTARAAAACRRAVRRAARVNPEVRLAIIGCGVDLGERWPETPAGLQLRLGNAGKPRAAGIILAWLNGEDARADGRGDFSRPGGGNGMSVSGFARRSRAFLKIQDGCGNGCAYCAVPLARGRPSSRPAGEIIAEADRLIGAGFGELVLTGINIGAWRDGGLDFSALVERLSGAPGLVRLRLGSVEPPWVDARLVEIMRDNGKICPHIHMPLQSGDDGVLAAMGRRYAVDDYLAKAELARERLDLPALGADVMVGFPGEDAAAFENTLKLCRRVGFSRLHVFPFSPRPGTPAAAFRNQIPERVANERKNRLIRLGREMAEAFAVRCLGREERVVAERDGGLSDRYLRVRIGGAGAKPGEAIRARIVGVAGDELLGERV